MEKIEKLKIQSEYNEKRIDVLNKKADVLYKIIFTIIAGIIALNMNNYYFEENVINQKIINFEKNNYPEKDYEIINHSKDISIETMQNISQKLDIVREKIEKMIKEIKINKEINEYVKDYFSLYFYLISFFIIILIKYYIEIIIIERKNKIIGEKIIEYSQINNFYKKKKN